MLSVSLLETVNTATRWYSSPFRTTKSLEPMESASVRLGQPHWDSTACFSGAYLCMLHGHYFLLHRKLEATAKTRTEISTNECFLSCSLCTLSPHVSLGVVSTKPSSSSYSLLIIVSVLQTRTQIHKAKLA